MTHRRIKAKVVFLGDSGVGKTSIILRYDGQGFNNSINPTLGANYILSSVPVPPNVVELQIWDTAGQERFRSMVPMYLRNAKVVILVYDLTNRRSFERLENWIEELYRANADAHMVLVVLGNKKDLESQRKVREEEGREFAEKHNAIFWETSALDNSGIEPAILFLSHKLVKSDEERTEEERVHETVDVADKQRKLESTEKKCCS